MVNRRSDTDLGNTQSAPRGGESDCVLDRHGRFLVGQYGGLDVADRDRRARRSKGGRPPHVLRRGPPVLSGNSVLRDAGQKAHGDHAGWLMRRAGHGHLSGLAQWGASTAQAAACASCTTPGALAARQCALPRFSSQRALRGTRPRPLPVVPARSLWCQAVSGGQRVAGPCGTPGTPPLVMHLPVHPFPT